MHLKAISKVMIKITHESHVNELQMELSNSDQNAIGRDKKQTKDDINHVSTTYKSIGDSKCYARVMRSNLAMVTEMSCRVTGTETKRYGYVTAER